VNALSLQFDEVEDARTCYNVYVRQKGFRIRKIIFNYQRKTSYILIEKYYVCSREGSCLLLCELQCHSYKL